MTDKLTFYNPHTCPIRRDRGGDDPKAFGYMCIFKGDAQRSQHLCQCLANLPKHPDAAVTYIEMGSCNNDDNNNPVSTTDGWHIKGMT